MLTNWKVVFITLLIIIIITLILIINFSEVHCDLKQGSAEHKLIGVGTKEYSQDEIDQFTKIVKATVNKPLTDDVIDQILVKLEKSCNKWSKEQITSAWYLYATQASIDAHRNLKLIKKEKQAELYKKAQEYELEVEKKLILSGVKFKTQEDLMIEQEKEYGRSMWTPDFLLEEPIEINGHLIYWIDAKNYLLTNVPFIVDSLTKKSAKYVEHFGPGALIFHYGFVDSVKIPDVVLLSDA
jgi:hypothetical protein